VFGKFATFDDAIFGDCANFDGATFNEEVSFEGAAFGWWASFAYAIFKGGVEFTGKLKEQYFSQQRQEDLWRIDQGLPDRFVTISFANSRFDGEAVFFRRSFDADADFTNTLFYYPPDLDDVQNAGRLDFTGASVKFVPPGSFFHWTTDTVPVRLRALRKLAEETKNHDLERDLYIEERKAERGVYWHRAINEYLNKEAIGKVPINALRLLSQTLWIIVMVIYGALADYGRSFARPLAWLLASVFFFYWRYLAVLAEPMAKAANIDTYKQAVRMLALGNTVPFVGPLTIDPDIKKFLFCGGPISDNCWPVPPDGYQLAVLSQNLLSIILVFFIGLALRNYFKIK
jgi:hypothetical protein